MAIVRANVRENPVARRRQQDGPIRCEVLLRVDVLVEEVEEKFILLRQQWTTFARSWQRERPAHVEAILMLQQLWLRYPGGGGEKGIRIELIIAIGVVYLAMITGTTPRSSQLDLCNA